MYFSKSFFGEDNKAVEVEIICDKCGKIINIEDQSFFSNVQSEYCVSQKRIICECGNISTPGIIERKKNISLNQATIKKSNYYSNIPKCPTCGSTNIEKISLTKKALGGVMFGLFSSDVRNTMRCKNCGAKW